jgi:FAD/FMN-containing dehydrogenase
MATEPESPGGPDRRRFLLLAGAAIGAGTAGVLALAAGGRHRTIPVGRAVGASPVSRPGPRATAPGAGHPAPGPADWASLGRQLSSGQLIRPGSAGYDKARLLFDPKFDDGRPAAIAFCAVPQDVSACLDFVRTFSVPVAVRSGGHSYGGWSSTAGLIIDVSMMSEVRIDVAARSARVGAGTLLVDLYSHLAAAGQAVPAGSCPTVGVAGLALGGGIGVVGRLYGLTCDNILAVQIVTADGAVRECTSASNPDLFWACRGGGGGSFGVVTAFSFRTHPAPDLVLFYLEWPWSQAEAVVSAWQSWAPFAPDELWSNLHLAAAPGDAAPGVSVGGTYAGGITGAQALLDQLYTAVGTAPASIFVRAEPYLSAMLVEAGCATLSVAQCHLPTQDPAGVLGRQPEYAKSDFFNAKLPPRGIRTLLAAVERMRRVQGAPGAAGGVALDAFGGVINRIDQGATAFVHRSALFLAQYSTTWTPITGGAGAGASTGAVVRQRSWLRSCHADMRPHASGEAYQNYADPDLADWQQAYYGANYPALQRIKAAVDPANVFRFPQSVELPVGSGQT